MKNFILFSLVVLLFSCNQNEADNKSPIETYADSMVEQYPNYESNEISEKAINDSIRNHCNMMVGKEAHELNKIKFNFIRIIDGKNGHCALFNADIFSSIDAPEYSNDKYVNVTINIYAFGLVDDSIAVKLDSNKKYSINGFIHAWDEENTVTNELYPDINELNFGTFILDSIRIEEVKQ